MELSYDESIKQLRDWRNSAMRKSKETIEIGQRVICKTSTQFFNDEIWLICEQVCMAALDTSHFDLADQCIGKLKKNFPSSIRVAKLDAMRLEASGDLDEALDVYNNLIEKDPTNSGVRKRKVALLKTKGDYAAAIKELCKYLQDFMVDHEAWFELSELYIKEMDYAKAAFCFEELILFNAFNHLYHQRYAEIKYTQGGQECLEIARKHFSQAIKLSSNTNMRALNGLLYTCFALSSSATAGKQSAKSSNARTHATWAAKMILKKYEEANASSENAASNSVVHRRKESPQFLASATLMLKQLGAEENP